MAFCQVHASVVTYWIGIHTCISDILVTHSVDNNMLHVTHVYVPDLTEHHALGFTVYLVRLKNA